MTDRTNGSIPRRGEARQALLNAAVSVIRRRSGAVHLPGGDDGTGGIRHQPGGPPRLRGQHPRPRRNLEADFAAALAAAGSGGEVDAASLALHTQTVLQGEFVLSKTAGDSDYVIEAIDHLHRYVQCVLGRTST